jgi:DNA-binding NarL/FixJ family response regulator
VTEPYTATVRVLSTAGDDAQEHAGPIVIEVIIRVQPDAPASVPSIPVELPPLPAVLTRREQDVMNLVTQRYTNAEIANTLVVSKSTVKYHVQNILNKLGVRSRCEVLRVLQRPGGAPQ